MELNSIEYLPIQMYFSVKCFVFEMEILFSSHEVAQTVSSNIQNDLNSVESTCHKRNMNIFAIFGIS